MTLHCSDNQADRAMGAYWERQFCLLAATYGLWFSPLQIGRQTSAVAWCGAPGTWHSLTLPDITIWTAPGQHHEIKHKAPTGQGYFGLEAYRFRALIAFTTVTRQAVFYTIHNHALAGGREQRANDLRHWITANVNDLRNSPYRTFSGSSYVNGKRVDGIAINYWRSTLWQPLETIFDSIGAIEQTANEV